MDEEEPLSPEEMRTVQQALASGKLTGPYRDWAMAQVQASRGSAAPAEAPEEAPLAADAGPALPDAAPPAEEEEEELPPMGPPLPPDYGYEQDPEEEELAPVGGEPLTAEEQAQYGLEPDAAAAVAPEEPQPYNPNAEYNDLYGVELDPDIPIDPRLPIMPQVLSMSPGTNHPEGDEAARHEWLNGDVKGDAVIFYEPPLEVARRELMEKPELVKMLTAKATPEDPMDKAAREFSGLLYGRDGPPGPKGGFDYEANPEMLTELAEHDPLYQAYADYKHLQAVGEATKAGRSTYRASKAPWLQGGKTQSVLDTLGMKLNATLKQGLEGVEAFVLGVDDGGYFRAGRRGAEVYSGDDPVDSYGPAVGEHTGGIPDGETMASRNHMLVEEYPELFQVGQALGGAAPWTLVGKAFNLVARGAPTMSPLFRGPAKAGAPPRPPPQPLSLGKRGLVAGGTGATASTMVQGVQEGVDAAASLAMTDGESTGTTLPEAGKRIAGAFGMGLAGGVGGEALGSGFKAHGDFVRHSKYFGQRPGKVEKLGAEFKFGRGPVKPKEVDALERRGRAMDPEASPTDIVARELAPHIEDAVEAHGLAAKQKVGAAVDKFIASPEGQVRMPLKNFVEESTKVLRKIYDQFKPGGAMRPVGLKAAGRSVKDAWNQAVVRVSPNAPKAGGIELKPREALAFMDADKREELAKQLGLDSKSDAAFLQAFKDRKLSRLWAHPAPLDAEHTETVFDVLKGYSKDNPNDRFMQWLDEAARRDRDARPMNGRRGAWSELQGQHSKVLSETEEIGKEAAPRGRAFNALINAATDKAGDIYTKEALQKMAEKAGVGDRFRTLMLLDPLETLRNESLFGHHRRGFREAMPGFANQVFDAAVLRGTYPIAKMLEGPLGPLRGGMGGRISTQVDDVDSQDEQVARIRKALSQQAAQQGQK